MPLPDGYFLSNKRVATVMKLFLGRMKTFATSRTGLHLLALSASVLILTAPDRAHAEFSVCNQSLDVLNVAIGYEEDGDFQTEGWWSVGVNRCADVIREPLKSRFLYVYAEDVFGQAVIKGNVSACIGTKRFLIRGTHDCWIRGNKEVGFDEVDTKDQARWTLFLKSK